MQDFVRIAIYSRRTRGTVQDNSFTHVTGGNLEEASALPLASLHIIFILAHEHGKKKNLQAPIIGNDHKFIEFRQGSLF